MKKTILTIFFGLTLIGTMPMEGSCCKPRQCKVKSRCCCCCKGKPTAPIRSPVGFPTTLPIDDPSDPPVEPPSEPPVDIVVVYVDNSSFLKAEDGSIDFPYQNIYRAVASGADEIRVVATSVPHEVKTPITLGKNQALISLSAASAILSVTSSVGIVLSDGCTVSGFVIEGNGSSGQIGILAEGASQCAITENAFSDLYIVVALDSSFLGEKSSVIGNTFTDVGLYGVCSFPSSASKSSGAHQLVVERNTFINPDAPPLTYAIYALDVDDLTVLSNSVSSFYIGFIATVTASSGNSLYASGNAFTDIGLGNGVDGYQTMVLTQNKFSSNGAFQNTSALGVALRGGESACITDNEFTGSNGSSSSAGFRVAVLSPGTACLQLTGNRASRNTTDYNLNPTAYPLSINADYATGNEGTHFAVNGPLSFVAGCPSCASL